MQIKYMLWIRSCIFKFVLVVYPSCCCHWLTSCHKLFCFLYHIRSRIMEIAKETCRILCDIFRAVSFRMPHIFGTVSHPDNVWIDGSQEIDALCFSAVCFIKINFLVGQVLRGWDGMYVCVCAGGGGCAT